MAFSATIEAMSDVIRAAIPFFIVFVILEAIAYHFHRDEDEPGYEVKDTATSLTMGLGNVIINIFWKAVLVIVLAAAYDVSPLRVPMDQWWAWPLLIMAEDFCFYWWHRAAHEVRVMWASHVVHHSSQHFNLSTALRQEWLPMFSLPFFAPLGLLGFPPWAVILTQTISLIYQFTLHTEKIDRYPRPIEYLFNTPSHHRVHHGANKGYLDRNYGGILIIWDRLFGSFRGEDDRVVYGLTKNVDSFNPLRVATHEWADLITDVKAAPNLRAKLGYLFHGPGWRHDASDRQPKQPA